MATSEIMANRLVKFIWGLVIYWPSCTSRRKEDKRDRTRSTHGKENKWKKQMPKCNYRL